MSESVAVPRYGVKEQVPVGDTIDRAAESLNLLGYAFVDGGYSDKELDQFAEHFDLAHASAIEKHGGLERLKEIDEHNTIRALLAVDRLFLDLACNANVLDLCDRILGDYYILNQQNGIINPPNRSRYNQGLYHRDLPYQHFVLTRPIAINALFCIDEFTLENGATKVVPGSHKQEAFPSDLSVTALEQVATAPRGSFIVLDCMTYHSGGINQSTRPRRAVNNVYSLPIVKQQINLPSVLDESYAGNLKVARLLNFGNSPARSVEDYYDYRRQKIADSEQTNA